MSIDPSSLPMVRHGAATPFVLKPHAERGPSHDAHTPPQRHIVDGVRSETASLLTAERDTAGRVLAAIAERALERPPRDMQKLVASAAKFLLINLEPALELAEQVRVETTEQPSSNPTELVKRDRNAIAAELLLSE